ncbi:DNA-directed DNA polymerase [Tilletia horrida]|uniref:DNA-directed DNA polymerase n=1 Tax=Tilletia horrida TaxID=155126 RepID=A0AAN6G4M1_9BASI|nr:DNA-directed DNA polymerase [Tilletia horrida]
MKAAAAAVVQGPAAASGAGTVLTLFWKLAETDAAERLAASSALIDILLSQQQQHPQEQQSPLQHPAGDEAELLEYEQHSSASVSQAQEARADRIIDRLCTPDVAYSLRRLIRGLASPRQGARQGFAVALAELLARLKDLIPLAPDVILTLILRDSVSTRSAKPAEARELLFARLFGIHALFCSRIIFQDDDIDPSDEAENTDRISPYRVMPGSNLRVFERTLDILFSNVATFKTWIRQSATWLGLQAIAGLLHIESADLSWRDEAIEIIYSRVASAISGSRLDMDTLAFVIGLSPVLSPEQLKSLLCPPFASPHLLATANLPALARILKELPLEDDADPKTGSTASWTPDLHLVWDQLLDIYYPPSAVASPPTLLRTGAAPFADFFRVLIDESLFAPTSSPERKSWGFTLVQHLLARLAAKTNAAQRIRDVPLLFQPNFVRTWINQLSDSSRILHKAARKTAQALLNTLQTTPAPADQRTLTSLALLTTLLTPPLGLRNFDQVTKTRTIEGILATLDGSGLDRYVAFLEGEILRSADAAPATANGGAEAGRETESSGRRKWAIDQLLGVVRFRTPVSAAPSQRGGEGDIEAGSSQQQQAGLRDEGVVLRVLRFLATHGWFEAATPAPAEPEKKKGKKSSGKSTKKDDGASTSAASVSLDAPTRALLRARFLSSIQDLNALPSLRTEPDGKKHRVVGLDSSPRGELWVAKAWGIIEALEAEGRWKAVEIPVEHAHEHEEGEDEEEEHEHEDHAAAFVAAREKAEDVLKALRQVRVKAEEKAKSSSDRSELERVRGLEAVLVGALLFVYVSRGDAAELLEPLADSISALLKITPTSSDDELTPDEAFVDAILGLLNRPSAFLRALATQAFGASSDLISPGGLRLLFESLVPSDADAMDEDIEEDEDDEEEENEEDDDDGKAKADSDDDGEDDDDDEDEEDDDSETSADSDLNDEVDPELRSKVLKALQASGIADTEKDDGAEDEDDEDDSDAESDVTMLDDEQMMKLDDKLASIFRSQLKGKNAVGADEHKEAIAQQNKVLDLLDAYASRQAGSPLALSLVGPLLSVMRSADKDSQQVANRAATILRSRLGGGAGNKAGSSATTAASSSSSSSSNKAAGAVDVEALVADLEEVHTAVTELTQPEHIGACISASTVLVRALLNQQQQATSSTAQSKVLRVHRRTVQALFQRRGARPKPNFVRDVLSRSPIVAWGLADELVDILGAAGNAEEEKKLRSDYVKQLQPLLHVVLANSLQLPEVKAKDAAAFLTKLNNQILSILREASGSEAHTSSAHRVKVLRELIKFAQQASKSAQRLSSAGEPATICNLAGWETVLETLSASDKLGGAKALLTQVQQLIASLRKSSNGAAPAAGVASNGNGKDAASSVKAKGKKDSNGPTEKQQQQPPTKKDKVSGPAAAAVAAPAAAGKKKKAAAEPNGASPGKKAKKAKSS